VLLTPYARPEMMGDPGGAKENFSNAICEAGWHKSTSLVSATLLFDDLGS